MAMEEVALVDKKLVTGKVVQFPVLVRVTIFSSTAAVDYSKKDEEVDRLSVFEYLVLSPLIAKKEDKLHEQDKLIQQQQDEIKHQKQLRQDERLGRIAIESKHRKLKIQEELTDGQVNWQIIGTVESPFPDRRGTPRQPILVPAGKGLIRFNKKIIQFSHYAELAQFSHLWVIFQFHENTNYASVMNKTQSKAKIRPPRLHGKSVGCLSTRSPHRPNAVGLSVCEIVEVNQEGIIISCLDMVDGTPVLDVKPYIPYDLLPSDYILPMMIDCPSRKLKVPDWVIDWDVPMRNVQFSSHAEEGLAMACSTSKQSSLRHSHSVEEARDLIVQVLRQDIRGLTHRSQDESMESYLCRLDGLTIRFMTTSSHIEIMSIESTPSAMTVLPEDDVVALDLVITRKLQRNGGLKGAVGGVGKGVIYRDILSTGSKERPDYSLLPDLRL
eukprot:gene4748-5203_t